jgi:hypothetical protein
MKPHDNTAKARHIGAESSSTRSSIAKRALQQANLNLKALRRSEITHFRWSPPAFGCLVHPMQASSRWDPTRGDLCSRLQPGQRIFTSRTGYWYTLFYFDLTGGSQGTSQRPPISPRKWGQAARQ